jgi:urea transporter
MNWVNTGALGFSAVLTAILFSSSTYKWYEALASTLLTIAISIAFLRLDGIMLTAPFVFASWFVIGTKKLAAGK